MAEKEKKQKVRHVRLEEKGLTAFELKILAIICMVIDHAAYLFYWQIGQPTALLLRMIGRFTFPIMAFLLTEGFEHTRNRYAYVIRLLAFALLSMMPFYWLFGDPYNVLFTLAAGLLLLILQDLCRRRFPQVSPFVWMGVFFVLSMVLGVLMREFDWGLPGIVAIYVTGQLKRFPYWVQGIACTLVLFLISVVNAWFANGPLSAGNLLFYSAIPLGAIWISMYNGIKGGPGGLSPVGRQLLKYSFYAFYPLHLLLLYMITKIV